VDISVVIPTRERWPELEGALGALARQDLGGIAAELVVVDNFSTDGSAERLEEAAANAREGPPLRMVHEPARGAGAARNAGVAAAAGELVLFLEDDCRPADAGLLAGHVREQRASGQPTCVVGAIDWEPDVGVTPLMEWLLRSAVGLDYGRRAPEPRAPFLFCMTNVSLPRNEVLAANGFDQRFQGHDVEDHELALRLADRGLRFSHRAALRVRHARRYELRASLGRVEAIGRGLHSLRRLHRDRSPPPARYPGGLRAFAGRLTAPAWERLRVPERWLSTAHYALLARGYAGSPRPDLEVLRGGPRPLPDVGGRPPVSVVVPFAGDQKEATEMLAGLAALRRRDDDEIVVADNTPAGVLRGEQGPGVRVVSAREEQSAYHARNVGAAEARNEWLLLLDSDCRPSPTLLDDYFSEPIDPRCGAVAGLILDPVEQPTWAGRYVTSRRRWAQDYYLGQRRPHAVAGSLLVRRLAWTEIGGFLEGIRSGGDVDLSLRLQDAGWSIGYCPRAGVEHRHRHGLGALLRQQARYGAGRAWLNRRHPGCVPRPRLDLLPRAIAGIGVWAITARFERAIFRMIDVAVVAAESAGYLLDNAPRAVGDEHRAAPELVLLADTFPTPPETEHLGDTVRIEALGRPARPAPGAARGAAVSYLEDDGILRRLSALAWLVARHPLRSAADLGSRGRSEGEALPLRALAPLARRLVRLGARDLRAHSGALSAPSALRLSRLTGVPCSVSPSQEERPVPR
jgi:GT2 family glycosyltransferase